MCVKAQAEKAAPEKFKEVRRTSNALGSDFSAILKSGCIRASVSGRYRSCRRVRV